MNNYNEYKEINYLGTKIKVNRKGNVIWNGKIRNPYLNHDGYLVCSIKTVDKGWRSVRIHRLVALAFIPNPNNLPEVNHKDYNRQNPIVDNLEWVTRKENVNYSKCNMPDYTGTNNPNYGNHKLSTKYKNDKELSKLKNSRPKLQNGRCIKIDLYIDDVLIKKFDYIGECCEYIRDNILKKGNLDHIRKMINKSIRTNIKYKNMSFIKR